MTGTLTPHTALRQSPECKRRVTAAHKHRPLTFPVLICRAAGYTLSELLIAMGIFAIGFVAVASIFPAAVLMQKQTIDDVLARQVTRNATAILHALQLDATSLESGTSANLKVQPIDLSSAPFNRFSLAVRSYPGTETAVSSRTFFWVPLVQRTTLTTPTNKDDWKVYVFILRRGDGSSYPKPGGITWANGSDPDTFTVGPDVIAGVPGVRSVGVSVGTTANRLDFNTPGFNDTDGNGDPDQIMAGNEVLDSNGIIYKVTSSDADGFEVNGYVLSSPSSVTEVWYSPPSQAGRPSPCKRILVIVGAVR